MREGINNLKKLFATRAIFSAQNVGIFFNYLSRLSTNRFGWRIRTIPIGVTRGRSKENCSKEAQEGSC
jgi:hypothetical protein